MTAEDDDLVINTAPPEEPEEDVTEIPADSVGEPSVKTKWGITVSAELTAKLGNTISVDTPKHTTTNARYGVYRLKVVGESYVVHQNCTTTPKHKVVTYSPLKVGWYLWES